MDSKKFGKKIKRLRLEKGIGLRAMAEKAGISPAYLSRIESGRELPPKGERIVKFAKVLEVPSDDLLSLAGKIDPAIKDFITQTPSMPEFLRRMRDNKISPDEIEKIIAKIDNDQGK